jgi:hypothetical protein
VLFRSTRDALDGRVENAQRITPSYQTYKPRSKIFSFPFIVL